METVNWKIGAMGDAAVFHYRIPEEYAEQGDWAMVFGRGSEQESWNAETFKRWLGFYLTSEGTLLERLQVADSRVDWEGCVCVLVGETLWIRARSAQVWLVRGGRLVDLLEAHDQVVGVHGPVQESDRLVVNTTGTVLMAETIHDLMLWSRSEEAVGGVWFYEPKRDEEMGDDAAQDGEMDVDADELLQEMEEESLEEEKLPAVDETQVSGWRMWVSDTASSVASRLPEDESIYVIKDEVEAVATSGTRRGVKILGVLLLLLLVGIGGWGVWQQKETVFEDTFGAVMNQVEYKLDESVQLADLNPLRSQALLHEAEQLITKLENQGLDNEYLAPLRRELEEAKAAALKQYYPEPVVWQTLSLIREDMMATDVDMDAGYMWILDTGGSRLVRLDTVTKSAEVINGDEQLRQAMSLGVAEGTAWVVGANQMWRMVDGTLETINGAGNWGTVVDAGGFGVSGYALTSRGLFRARQPELGQWEVAQWLQQSTLDSWLPPSSMTIDGSIWVSRGSDVLKLDSGRGSTLSLTGLDSPLGTIADIYTSEDMPHIYVLDKDNGRVVVFDKVSGEYVAQYLWDGLGNVGQVLASETAGMMWWVSESVIYGVEI